MLLLAGLGAGGAMLCLLCVHVALQYSAVYSARQTVQEQSLGLQFPCIVKGTDLTALQLASYDGPFWEDGSADEVAEIAALVIQNTGDSFVAEGAVVLDWGEDRFVFEFSGLPPGQKVLVLEKMRKAYQRLPEFRCSGWSREETPADTQMAEVLPAGMGELAFLNTADVQLSGVTAVYKHYDPGSGMLIGGIAYRETVVKLQPGERRTVTPRCYSGNASRIVQVTVERHG